MNNAVKMTGLYKTTFFFMTDQVNPISTLYILLIIASYVSFSVTMLGNGCLTHSL
jgi:hypothetical protein